MLICFAIIRIYTLRSQNRPNRASVNTWTASTQHELAMQSIFTICWHFSGKFISFLLAFLRSRRMQLVPLLSFYLCFTRHLSLEIDGHGLKSIDKLRLTTTNFYYSGKNYRRLMHALSREKKKSKGIWGIEKEIRRSFHFNVLYGNWCILNCVQLICRRIRISFYHNNGDGPMLFVLKMTFHQIECIAFLLEHTYLFLDKRISTLTQHLNLYVCVHQSSISLSFTSSHIKHIAIAVCNESLWICSNGLNFKAIKLNASNTM